METCNGCAGFSKYNEQINLPANPDRCGDGFDMPRARGSRPRRSRELSAPGCGQFSFSQQPLTVHLILQIGLLGLKEKLFGNPVRNILHMAGQLMAQVVDFKTRTFGHAPATKVAYQ
jgi:hypothetical protein